MILPGIPVLFWLRPKTRLLGFSGDRDKGLMFFQMICWATITVTTIVAQHYMVAATAKLQRSATIETLKMNEDISHVQIDEFSIDTANLSSTPDVTVSGKNSQDLNIDLYVVLPFLKNELIGESHDARLRYAIKFHKQLNNRDSEEEKRLAFSQFLDQCAQDISSYDFQHSHFFKRVRPSEELDQFRKAATESKLESDIPKLIFLEPQGSSFESRTGNLLPWSFGSFAIGLTVILIFLIVTSFEEKEYNMLLSGKKVERGDLENSLLYLIPRGNHFVTSILMDVILILFLAMIFSGSNILYPRTSQLMDWGAIRRPEILQGQWWRLITGMFIHGGVIHLVSNIIGLAMAAIFVEPLLGRRNYLIVYLVAGIAGGITSIAWHPHTASVGASGAILGLYGTLFALALLRKLPGDTSKAVLIFAGIFIGFNLLYGLTGGIDNAAHLGGLFAGMISGVLLYKPSDSEAPADSGSDMTTSL